MANTNQKNDITKEMKHPSKKTGAIIGAVAGAAIGAIAGIALSNKETREKVVETVTDATEKAVKNYTKV